MEQELKRTHFAIRLSIKRSSWKKSPARSKQASTHTHIHLLLLRAKQQQQQQRQQQVVGVAVAGQLYNKLDQSKESDRKRVEKSRWSK